MAARDGIPSDSTLADGPDATEMTLTSDIPEPATLLLLVAGLVFLKSGRDAKTCVFHKKRYN